MDIISFFRSWSSLLKPEISAVVELGSCILSTITAVDEVIGGGGAGAEEAGRLEVALDLEEEPELAVEAEAEKAEEREAGRAAEVVQAAVAPDVHEANEEV